MKKWIFLSIFYLFFINVVLASSTCTRDDFIMGATSFYYTDVDKVAILKNHGFNWLGFYLTDSDMIGCTVNPTDPACDGDMDYNQDSRQDYKDLFTLAERVARGDAGWNFKYNLNLLFGEDFKDYTNEQLYDMGRTIAQNVVNKNYEVGMYTIGGELEFGNFTGLCPFEAPYNVPKDSSNPDPQDWQNFWKDVAAHLKPIIDGIKSVDTDAKIVIRSAFSHEPTFIDEFVYKMKLEKVEFDFVGLTTPADFGFICDLDTLTETAEKIGKYEKKVIISEWSYPNDLDDVVFIQKCLWGWELNPEMAAERGYPYTQEGQAACIRDQIQYFDTNPHISGAMYVFPLFESGHEFECVECGKTQCTKPFTLKKSALEEIRKFMSVGSSECVGKFTGTTWNDSAVRKNCDDGCIFTERCDLSAGSDQACVVFGLNQGCCSGCYNVDLNNDGITNILDLSIVSKSNKAKPGDDKWNALADINDDGTVNIMDISMVAKKFGMGCTTTIPQQQTEELGISSSSMLIVLISIVSTVVVVFVIFKLFRSREQAAEVK